MTSGLCCPEDVTTKARHVPRGSHYSDMIASQRKILQSSMHQNGTPISGHPIWLHDVAKRFIVETADARRCEFVVMTDVEDPETAVRYYMTIRSILYH